jgi:hypothetical protein
LGASSFSLSSAGALPDEAAGNQGVGGPLAVGAVAFHAGVEHELSADLYLPFLKVLK